MAFFEFDSNIQDFILTSTDPNRIFSALDPGFDYFLSGPESSDDQVNGVNNENTQDHNSYYFNTLRSNLYAINYWNLDPQIQEILRRVYTRCFNNCMLLSYCRFFAIGEISSVSFSPAHDYDIPNTHTHSQSSHEAYASRF